MGPAMNVGNFFIREGSDGDGETVEYKNIWIESKCIEKHRIIIFYKWQDGFEERGPVASNDEGVPGKQQS